MKTIINHLKNKLQQANILPQKVVILPTGVTCLHFRNNKIKTLWK